MASTIDIFCCYARKDKDLLNELKTHLSPLHRQRLIHLWSDGDINAGDTWEEEIHRRLRSAQIVLLLISPDFIASDYCYDIEMRHALERQERGDAHVIPIILRHTEWQETPFGKLQALPTDGTPINSKAWTDRDEAFNIITVGIRKAAKMILSTQWVTTGIQHVQAKQYDEALTAFEKAIENDPSFMLPYEKKGDVLFQRNRYEEAVTAYEQAPNRDATMFMKQGKALLRLRQYEEALTAYETSIHLNGNEALAYAYKGYTLFQLGRDEEALVTCTQALQRDKECALASYFSCSILAKQQQIRKAEAAYQQAMPVSPADVESLHAQGDALSALKRYSEALSVYEQALALAPEDPSVYQSQGAAFFETSEHEKALNAYEQALGLNPQDATTYFYKGQTLEQLARQAYDKAKQYGYTGNQEGEAFFSSSGATSIALSPLKFKLLHTLEDLSKAFSSFALRPDGLVLASIDGKEGIQIWDVLTGMSLRTLKTPLDTTDVKKTSLAFSTDGHVLIAGIQNIQKNEDTTSFFLFSIFADSPLSRTFYVKGGNLDFFPLAVDSSSIYYVNCTQGISYRYGMGPFSTGIRPLDAILSATMSSDAHTILVGSRVNAIELWSRNEKLDRGEHPFERTRIITGHTGSTCSLAISPDGQTFASGSEDTTIKIWHLHTGKLLRTLSGHTESVQSVVISPDGCVLASGSKDRTLKMWDIHTGELLRTIDEHTEGVKQLAFSENGRILVSGDGKVLNIWEQQ